MTLVQLANPMAYPGIGLSSVNGPTFSKTTTVTSAGQHLAYIMSAKEDMTISHLGFFPGTASGSPTID
jgi:hypothetical protein